MNVKKMSVLCSDGASVMVGKKDGLASKLEKKELLSHCSSLHMPHTSFSYTDTNIKLKSIGNVEQIVLQF